MLALEHLADYVEAHMILVSFVNYDVAEAGDRDSLRLLCIFKPPMSIDKLTKLHCSGQVQILVNGGVGRYFEKSGAVVFPLGL